VVGTDESITLRPVQRGDLALLDQWRNDRDHESPYGDFLALHRRKTVNAERWEADGLLSEQEGQLLICRDGEPVGTLQWHPVQYGPNRGSIALNLGIAIMPTARGKGIGTRAQRMLADYLFEQTLTHRVEASTDVENLAEQKALERAGFSRGPSRQPVPPRPMARHGGLQPPPHRRLKPWVLPASCDSRTYVPKYPAGWGKSALRSGWLMIWPPERLGAFWMLRIENARSSAAPDARLRPRVATA
jgi:RimJ/RimL family protein N-acetyltransferase